MKTATQSEMTFSSSIAQPACGGVFASWAIPDSCGATAVLPWSPLGGRLLGGAPKETMNPRKVRKLDHMHAQIDSTEPGIASSAAQSEALLGKATSAAQSSTASSAAQPAAQPGILEEVRCLGRHPSRFKAPQNEEERKAVSYTHLTLPTILRV